MLQKYGINRNAHHLLSPMIQLGIRHPRKKEKKKGSDPPHKIMQYWM